MPSSRQPIAIPTFDVMMIPTIQALQQLGGSGNTDEIYAKVADLMTLPEEILSIPHGETSQTEVEYRLAWSRTYLRKHGVLERTARGVWAIAASAGDLTQLNPREIVRSIRDGSRENPQDVPAMSDSNDIEVVSSGTELSTNLDGSNDVPEEASTWNIKLHQVLLALTPAAFERLVQRLLRESGFIQVEVTGKSGDGGIDGVGIVRISGFLSFHVLFQAKRYQGSVSSVEIRNFRGAMQGRTDKGLFITTGTFTREAVKEATRDGVPPIDLIDGEQLVHLLKEHKLGLKIEMVESVKIDTAWFQNL